MATSESMSVAQFVSEPHVIGEESIPECSEDHSQDSPANFEMVQRISRQVHQSMLPVIMAKLTSLETSMNSKVGFEFISYLSFYNP